MIVGLRGKVSRVSPLAAVLDVGGVFYEVNVPITTAERLPGPGNEAFLHTVAIYREDSQTLYGFASAQERDFFRLLVDKVSGIGPKIAINIMSRMGLETLRGAIEAGDVAMLSKCPGIGKKTAERIVVELRGALEVGRAQGAPASGPGAPGGPQAVSDALAALIALGYKPADADRAVRRAAAALPPDSKAEDLIKGALRG